MDTVFEKQTFSKRLKSMLKVDFKRAFTMPLAYIMAGVCLVMPVLILVMTTVMGGGGEEIEGAENAVQAFTNVWQTIGSMSGAQMSMDLTSMCNINLTFFLIAVFVCIFVADDFRSGYVKNLFTVRSKKTDYVISKTLVGFVVGIIMLFVYFIGALIGGAIAGLSFDAGGASGGSIACCLFSKFFLSLIFVAVGTVMGTVAKQRLWLSIICSFGAGMLLFTMIPMIAPLDAGILNVVMCIAGGAAFGAGLGAVSCVVLNKTSLV